MEYRDLLQQAYRYAYSLTRSTHDAEDLVQNAWVKLMASKGNVENKSLLFTTIRNLFIDNYRRNNLILIESLDDIVETHSELHAQEKVDYSVLNNRDLESALAQLRAEENEAIFLSIVMGYTSAEIAEITDKSRNTVLSLISRGKMKLAELLSVKKTDIKKTL